MFLPQAISQDAKAPVPVLDNRAATYSKLGNLRAALKDGRQMIQQEKANCSVLQKPQSAITTYLISSRVIYVLVKSCSYRVITRWLWTFTKWALVKCPSTTLTLRYTPVDSSSGRRVHQFQLLRGQQEKLSRQLAPPKAIDPLQMLPLELAEMTIKYLEFRHMVSVSLLSLLC